MSQTSQSIIITKFEGHISTWCQIQMTTVQEYIAIKKRQLHTVTVKFN